MTSTDFAHALHLERGATRDPDPPTTADLTWHQYSGRVYVRDWVTATWAIPTVIGHAAPAGDQWVWIDPDGQGGIADTKERALEELLDAAMHDARRNV